MAPQELKHKVVESIKAVNVFMRHLSRRGEFAGSNSVYIAPISIWHNHIEVMVDTRRDVFKKAINRFIEENKEIVEYVRFIKGGGGCSPYIIFKVRGL